MERRDVLLALAGFEVVNLEICAGREANAEIYVTGKKPPV